jgi:ComEC/Rec2-related protein
MGIMNTSSMWNKAFSAFPLMRLLIALLLGFASFSFLSALYICVLSAALILIFRNRNIIYYCSIICVGYYSAYRADSKYIKYPSLIIPAMKCGGKGIISRVLRHDTLVLRCIVQGSTDTEVLPAIHNNGILLTVYRPDKRLHQIQPGMQIAFHGMAELPEAPGIPTEFNEALWCRAAGIQFKIRAASANVSIIYPLEISLSTFSYTAFATIKSIITMLYPEQYAGLVMALLLGDTSGLDRQMQQSYSVTGVAHIVSVSGFHISLIAAILYIPLGFIPLQWLRLVVFIISLTLFIVISGASPPALRSGIMGVMMMLAFVYGRPISMLNILAGSICILIIFQPVIIYSIGFQLSVAAMAGIILMAPRVEKTILLFVHIQHTVLHTLIRSISVSVAASICTAPLTASYFDMISLVAPLANLIIIPLITLGMLWSIASLFLYPLGIGSLFAQAALLLFSISDVCTNFIASIPFAAWQGRISFGICCFFCILFLYIFLPVKNRNIIYFRLIIVLFSCIILMQAHTISQHKKELNTMNTWQIYARRNIVLCIHQHKNGRNAILMLDRRPKLAPVVDKSAYILQQMPGIMDIAYRGNCSEYTALRIKDLKEEKNIRLLQIDTKAEQLLLSQLPLAMLPFSKTGALVQYNRLPDQDF